MHNYVRADRINVRDIFCCDSFPRAPARRAVDFLDSTVERGRNRVPKMEKSIFLEADVHKHRLQTHLDVFDSALVNAADDVPGSLTLDAVFLEPAILEQCDARLEFFYAEYEFVPRFARGNS